MACPYQFFARHALHLNELDEVTQALEKRDYGEYVHDILHRFHGRYPVVSDGAPEVLEQALNDISAGSFRSGDRGGFRQPCLVVALAGFHSRLSGLARAARARRLALAGG